jgi:cytochrome c-type biogenesis protein CcmH
MLLAAFCALLTLVVLGIVLLPLLRRAPAVEDSGRYDRAVYRDQLAELEADVARGAVAPDAAAAARLEIERRMLATTRVEPPPAPSRGTPIVATALVIALMLLPAAIYMKYGSPLLPDMPYAARVIPKQPATAATPGQHDLEKSVDALAAKLKSEPDNAEGWMLYARTLSALGRFEQALTAYKEVIRLVPDDPDVLSGYGEMQVMLADGIVTPGARDAFTKTLAKDPASDVARFYLALGDAQAGEPRKAIEAWLKLAADTPDPSEMRDEIARRIAESAGIAGIPVPPLPAGKPAEAKPAAAVTPATQDPDTLAAAAANMSPDQREKMIRGMVAQLAGKLDKNPADPDGWLKLGRAYLVLNDAARAADAYAHAAKLRPDDASIPLQQAAATIDATPHDKPVPPDVVAMLDRARAATPDEPEVYWYLGIAAMRNGNKIEAAAQWTHLLEMLPADGEDRKMVQNAIETLQKP